MTIPSSSRARIVYVDLLRLLATFQMVQGHTLDAVLDASLRDGAAFDRWSWVRGLTSVAFLFAAGVSFHLATLTRFDAYRADPAGSRRRVTRALLIVAIGYALHNPIPFLGSGGAELAAALRAAAIVDVLQCIGVSLLVLEGLTRVLPSARAVTLVSLGLAVVLVGLAPLSASIEATGPATLLLDYLTPSGGSIFPLFPWAGYLFAGVVAGSLASPAGARTPRVRSGVVLVGLGLAVAAAAMLFERAASPYPAGAPSLLPGLLKLGVVIALSGALALATLRLPRLPPALETLAGETLVVYVFHVVLLYAAGFGLGDLVGQTVGFGASIALAMFLIAASAAAGLGSASLKSALRARRPPALAPTSEAG